MKNLWSPWRSQYIESFKNESKESCCIFCEMIHLNENDEENLLVYKGNYSFIVLNLYPYNNGHMMIIPYNHISELQKLSKEESEEIFYLFKQSELALKQVMQPHGINIGSNLGRVSGAGIEDHIHFHVVPRWNGDTNFMPVIGEVKVISQDLLETKKNLLIAFKNLKDSLRK